MKKLFTLLAAVLLTAGVFLPLQAGAQSPEKMSYQAVIRNSSDVLVTDTQIGMQISILQGTEDGSPVYVETQTPTTNANGLVSIEIGNGIVLNGNFSSIDWTNGPYFIKTETDPAGGTSYTITGTSQLLSVPYALHAKTAEIVTGGITESDPVFMAWDKDYDDLTGTPANLSDFTNDIGYLTDYTVTETDVTTHQAALSVTESQISDLGTYIETETDPTVTKYSVGDFAQGGIVFWVDESGQHGLVAAKVDQDGGSGIQWYNGSYTDTEAHGDGVYAGEMNTILIVANQGSNSNDYAAGVCANYTVTESGVTYGDWYLPSKEELNLMYQNKAAIDATAGANGGSSFASAYYCSSTETNSTSAWRQFFSDGYQYTSGKSYTSRVHAVRAF